jgi:allantoinase
MIGTSAEKASGSASGEWAIAGRSVVTPEGLRPAAVVVRGETIAAVVPPEQVPAGLPVEDVGASVLLPGMVDTHVHINEPGRTEWEGFETATRAAAAGGITTLVDMPLNSSPVTTTPEALRQKLAAAEGKLWVDCGFYGGVIPASAAQMEPLIRAGVLGLKTFLCHSGIDEFPNATEADLRRAMPAIARSGLPLLVHAELPGLSGEWRVASGGEENQSPFPTTHHPPLLSAAIAAIWLPGPEPGSTTPFAL